MRKYQELNDYQIINPEGVWNLDPYFRIPQNSERPVEEYPMKGVPQYQAFGQVFPWRPEEDWNRREETDGESRTESRERTLWDAWEDEDSGVLSELFTALSVSAATIAAALFIASLFIHVTPCASMEDSLAFISSIRNPDGAPLTATLASENAVYEKSLTDASCLIFDGLERNAAYTLSITNEETGRELYNCDFITATEDAVRPTVANAALSEDWIFSFDLSMDGLPPGDFCTVRVYAPNGKVLFTEDIAEAVSSFSIPVNSDFPGDAVRTYPDGSPYQPSQDASQASPNGTSSAADGDSEETHTTAPRSEIPYVTVKVNGMTFLAAALDTLPLSADAEEPEREEKTDGAAREDGAETRESGSDGAPEIQWIWNGDEAIAFLSDPAQPGQTAAVKADVTKSVKEATCTEDGFVISSAVVKDMDGAEHMDVRTETVPAKGHDFQQVSANRTKDGASAEYACSVCGERYRMAASVTEDN